MSRCEGEFQAAGDGSITLTELLRLAADATLPERQRQSAIACYLSASEGWRDAGRQLGGAFADDPGCGPGSVEADKTGPGGGEQA